jgi:hypothetical protein
MLASKPDKAFKSLGRFIKRTLGPPVKPAQYYTYIQVS